MPEFGVGDGGGGCCTLRQYGLEPGYDDPARKNILFILCLGRVNFQSLRAKMKNKNNCRNSKRGLRLGSVQGTGHGLSRSRLASSAAASAAVAAAEQMVGVSRHLLQPMLQFVAFGFMRLFRQRPEMPDSLWLANGRRDGGGEGARAD